MRRQFWATVFCLGVLFPSFINSQKVQAQKLDIENNYSLVPVSSFSFNSPFYLVRGTIPFWKFGGDAVVTDDYLRLTPAEKSRNGWIFGTKPYPFESWSVEIKFKIGGGGSLGADGMAFWYTESPQVTGSTPVFGVHDTWKGLGVIFDTFDNDRQGNNPYVSVLYNDGTWTYEPQTDGSNRELGGCKLNYRNWDSRARITYIDGVLQVEVIVPTISSEWTLCTSVPVNLPPGHFFGLSAATGGLVDNHDVMGFSTSRIMPKGVEPTEEDTKKFEEIQRKKIKPVMSAGVFSPVSDRVADEEPQEQQERQEQKQEQQQTGSNDLKGLKNRAQTITTTLKNSIHEYEDTTGNEKPQQTYTPPVQQQTNTANTYTTPPQGGDLVQVLINEINLLKNQQTTLQNSLSSLQNNVNSFVNNNRKNVEDLNNLLSTQQKLSESLDRLLITAPTKEDIKQAGSSAPSALDTQVQQLIRLVGEVKSVLNDKLNQNVENTNRQIESLVRTVNEMRGKVEQTRSSQSQIEASIRTNTQEMSETIERSTSWGFWIYFLLFQAVFGIAFMWWKKYRDDNNKKFL